MEQFQVGSLIAGLVAIAGWVGYRLGKRREDIYLPVRGAQQQRVDRVGGRYVFYVDVGDLPPEAAEAYLKKVKAEYERSR